MALLNSQILIGVLLLLVVILLVMVVRLELRLNKLTKGTDKKNLESGLHEVQRHAKEFSEFKESTLSHLKNIERRLTKSVQKVATIRFNPFAGTGQGGAQSFATALLDEGGNGVVISTINTRERVGVFSKAIKNGTSEYELTPEELSSIKLALANK